MLLEIEQTIKSILLMRTQQNHQKNAEKDSTDASFQKKIISDVSNLVGIDQLSNSKSTK